MREFIIQYWMQVLFGLVCGAAAFLATKHKKIYKDNQAEKEKDLWDDIKKTIYEDHKTLEAKIDAVNEASAAREKNVLSQLEITTNNLANMKTGILSV